jgi:hypothetical protein
MFSSKGSAGHAAKALGLICASLTAAGAIVGLATPSCHAQGVKGPAAQGEKLTPQQVHDVLVGSLRGPAKVSPRISNPLVSNMSGESSVIGALRSQKQAADAERQEISAGRSVLADGSVRPSGQNLPGRASSATPGAPGVKVAPLPPFSTAVAPKCPQPRIDSVSKQARVVFTPIPEWNLYTVKGCGFGMKPGNIYLEGPFASGQVPLMFPSPKDWSDTAIVAQLNPQLSGESDHDNVTLVIQPQGGAPLRVSGFKFYAARETVLLEKIPQRVVQFSGPALSSAQPLPNSTSNLKLGFYASYFTPSHATPPASADVGRAKVYEPTPSPDVLVPGSDYYDFSALSPGFHPNSMQLAYASDSFSIGQQSLPSCPSSGDWKAQWDGNNIRVSWKVLHCGGWGPQLDKSDYSLSVWVTGPRGVDPWSMVRGVKTMGLH